MLPVEGFEYVALATSARHSERLASIAEKPLVCWLLHRLNLTV